MQDLRWHIAGYRLAYASPYPWPAGRIPCSIPRFALRLVEPLFATYPLEHRRHWEGACWVVKVKARQCRGSCFVSFHIRGECSSPPHRETHGYTWTSCLDEENFEIGLIRAIYLRLIGKASKSQEETGWHQSRAKRSPKSWSRKKFLRCRVSPVLPALLRLLCLLEEYSGRS